MACKHLSETSASHETPHSGHLVIQSPAAERIVYYYQEYIPSHLFHESILEPPSLLLRKRKSIVGKLEYLHRCSREKLEISFKVYQGGDVVVRSYSSAEPIGRLQTSRNLPSSSKGDIFFNAKPRSRIASKIKRGGSVKRGGPHYHRKVKKSAQERLTSIKI